MEEERIGLFLDFENLAIGAREQLHATFDYKPIADALAERGRVVVRRAYADWTMFGDAGRELTRHNVELIEIPQRMGAVRKNAADIKLAVDAIELSFEREYVTTFVICTGDSDFTPLVNKLRELNKKVIGIGVEAATSNMLPPACDEFLFYERLHGVESGPRPKSRRGGSGRGRGSKPAEPETNGAAKEPTDLEALDKLITQTLSGLKRGAGDVVHASSLKRTLLRKDPTFDESAYGFRSLGELLRNLEGRNVLKLSDGAAPGDPAVDFTAEEQSSDDAFELLKSVVAELGPTPLRGLKNQVRKKQSDFSEKVYGYVGFMQFVRAAQARGIVEMDPDEGAGTFIVRIPGDASAATPAPKELEAAEPEVAEPEPEAAESEAAEPVEPKRTPLIAAPSPKADPESEPEQEKPKATRKKPAARKKAPAKPKATTKRAPRKPKAPSA